MIRALSVFVLALGGAVCPGDDAPISGAPAASSVSLAGTWRFRLDPQKEGVAAGWFAVPLPDRIELPGSCQQRGFGTKTVQPWKGRLTPLFQYDGWAWYQRDFDVPPGWRGKRIELFLERCLWESSVWLDGQSCGSRNSLSTPHVYDLGKVAPGRHVVTVRIDNGYKLPIGTWVSAITEDTQGRWNGIIGRIELRATDPVWIEDLQAYPDVGQSTVKLTGRIGNGTGEAGEGIVQARLVLPGQEALAKTTKVPVTWTAAGGSFALEIPMSDAGVPPKTWDEFSPALYRVEAGLGPGAERATATFGFRNLAARKRQITVNGRPVLLRGAVDECVYPLTGHPPMDKEAWLRVLKICQSYGFNYMRFHSWCPPEAAFEAGDEVGFLFQVELPLWTMNAPPFGRDPARDRFIRDELDRILDAYGNHPSFGLMAMGNESSGALDTLVMQARARDPRHLVRCENGRDSSHGDYVEMGMRGVYGPRTDWDRWSASPGWIAAGPPDAAGSALPVVCHEAGQWEMYPDFDEIKKYTGVMRAYDDEGYRKSLEEHHMLDQDAAFSEATGKFSVLLDKEEIEGCLRTWPLGGFQILEARDYPGQGGAVVGWLDAFWDSKGLITPAEFRHFDAATVCLLRMPKRVWTTAESFAAEAEVSNYGADALEGDAAWSITDEQGRAVAGGDFSGLHVETGRVVGLGRIEAALSSVAAPARCVVKVGLRNRDVENSWNIWVYPAELPPASVPENVYIAHDFGDATQAALRNGGRVLLFSSPRLGIINPVRAMYGPDSLRVFAPVQAGKNAVPGSFMPAFWNMRLFNQIGTLGILCDPKHPAFADFPTESHSDWQWADLLGRFSAADSFHAAGAPANVSDTMARAAGDVSDRSKAIILDETPADYRPILQVVDNDERNSKLGMIFEARVGAGKLLVCAMDLETDQGKRPAARQLYRSLLEYAGGNQWAPAQELSVDFLKRILD